jgi:hypothetical protein
MFEVADLARLHDLLFDLTPSNFPICLSLMQSLGVGPDPIRPQSLLSHWLLAAKYRPQNVVLLFDLLTRICPPDFAARCFLAPHPDGVEFLGESYRVYLAYYCLTKGFLEINQIAECCSSFLGSPDRFASLLFIWFAPELSLFDSSLFARMSNLFETTWQFEYNSAFLYDVYDRFESFKKDDWKLLRECRICSNQLLELVISDNADSLQDLVSAPGFRIDQRIHASSFEWRIFLSDYPTLIQVASFYGSLKCFRYLLLNGADLGMCDFKGRSLAVYAVAGGNTEIVRILEQRDCSFAGCMSVACLFHRQPIVEWLMTLDLEPENLLIPSIVSCNFDAFLYCLEQKVDINMTDSDDVFFR